MKRFHTFVTFVYATYLVALLVCACLPVKTQDVKDVTKGALTVVQISCVFSSMLTDEHALAKVCDIADEWAPTIRDLIGQREGARRAGVTWPGSKDAGGDH